MASQGTVLRSWYLYPVFCFLCLLVASLNVNIWTFPLQKPGPTRQRNSGARTNERFYCESSGERSGHFPTAHLHAEALHKANARPLNSHVHLYSIVPNTLEDTLLAQFPYSGQAALPTSLEGQSGGSAQLVGCSFFPSGTRIEPIKGSSANNRVRSRHAEVTQWLYLAVEGPVVPLRNRTTFADCRHAMTEAWDIWIAVNSADTLRSLGCSPFWMAWMTGRMADTPKPRDHSTSVCPHGD